MKNTAKNPFTWLEIYVDDLPRAQKFYETVFQFQMMPMDNPAAESDLLMVSFPWAEEGGDSRGISGALCKTSARKPSSAGTVAYFSCDDCAIEAARVIPAGGQIVQEKFSIGPYGFCCIVEDTEGNTIGLHSQK